MKLTLRAVLVTIGALWIQTYCGEPESASVIQPKVNIAKYDAMPKDPLASALFSATICGSGQLYNKEYLRGIITGVAFWTSFFGGEYLMNRWQQINTDTFYLQDYFSDTVIHPVYVMRPDNRQVGLPTAEKALLVTACVVGASAYVFGLIDSYRGAQRYNKKLLAGASLKPEFYCDLGTRRNEAGLRLRF
jgi:TM2 domain-containing membrane protein YozV